MASNNTSPSENSEATLPSNQKVPNPINGSITVALLIVVTVGFAICWSLDSGVKTTKQQTSVSYRNEKEIHLKQLNSQSRVGKTEINQSTERHEKPKKLAKVEHQASLPENTEMFWTALSSISSAIAALVTLFTLFHAIEVWKEQTRPYVIADIEPTENRFVELVVKNIGRTVASSVSITVSPEILDVTGRNVLETLFEIPLAFLAPEKEVRTIIDKGYNFLAEDKPLIYTFYISYSSADGKKPYKESHSVSLKYLKHTVIVG